ncbi:MAG TPA: ATP-binding protein [Polyangiaceae bacterium]|nr:ATP-binding protein [Polyangiaceae bacterium]
MHRTLERQLRKLGVAADGATLPTLDQWKALLDRVERAYVDADQDRYTLERSIDLSSAEMKGLHRSLASERDKLRSIFESAALGIVRLDPAGRVLDANSATLEMFACDREQIEGRLLSSLFEVDEKPSRDVDGSASSEAPARAVSGCEERYRHADGTIVWVHITTNWVRDAGGAVEFGTAILDNITTRKRLECSLRHAQKLESVGRLAAGVAHEINTPVQFVSDNVHFLKTSFDALVALLEAQREIALAGPPDLAERHERASDEADLPFMIVEIPRALAEARDGLERVATIVRSMKAFAHADRGPRTPIDINAALTSTLTVARHEIKHVAETVTSFAELPPVLCHPGDLNQVFLNLFVNAAHAIGQVVGGSNQLGRITVTTRREGDDVIISVADTGGGIPEEVRGHLFEPFFTTKTVGQGSGQGLALARAIVVEKHRGAITIDTAVGEGTTFHVRLPIRGALAGQENAA